MINEWVDLPKSQETVPAAYRGVWVRTLLETPEGRDTSTRVHWLQTECWHADLRIPADVDPGTPDSRARLQGFYGMTCITQGENGQPDICTWHRHWDVQPPCSTPDAGYMVFETSNRVIETGVHSPYLEIWERLPGSTGKYLAQSQLDENGRPTGVHRFTAGSYAMTVRPRTLSWPSDLRLDETLADVISRHPKAAAGLLDFEIIFHG